MLLGLLGFSSGLPLLLTGQTLQAWLTDAHLDLSRIGVFAAIGLPYTFKFAWAPLVDRIALPLGRRRGWILASQLALAVGLAALALADPAADAERFAALAFAVACASATQDIAIDAYNADLLAPAERAAGSAAYVMGYRVALLLAGSLALVLADHVAWEAIYLGAAALVLGCGAVTLAAPNPEPPRGDDAPRTTLAVVVTAARELAAHRRARDTLLVLAFAASYKFGEQFVLGMLVPFLREVGYGKTEIGLVTKGAGFVAWAIGGAIGGALVARRGVRPLLVPFALLQIATHGAYLAIAVVGKNLPVFAIAIFVENVTYAMATSAFVAVLMAQCTPAASATQFALLTSLSSVGQRVFGVAAGALAERVGWPAFFAIGMALSLPGVACAWLLPADPSAAPSPRP